MATTDTNLYRALHKSEWPDDQPLVEKSTPAAHLLDPLFEPKTIETRGRRTIRAPDVQMESDRGVSYVRTGGGTSLFDREYVFGRAWWRSFTLPEGTQVPDSLKIVKGGYNEKFAATHYQIEVKAGRMEKGAFVGALDNLARNAIVRSIETAKQTQS